MKMLNQGQIAVAEIEGKFAVIPLNADGTGFGFVADQGSKQSLDPKLVPMGNWHVYEHMQNFVFYTDESKKQSALDMAFDGLFSDHSLHPEVAQFILYPERPFDLYSLLKKHWLVDGVYYDLLELHQRKNGNYVGKLPNPVSNALGGSDLAFEKISRIAGDLLSHRLPDGSWSKARDPEVYASELKSLDVSYINQGDDGVVYKLKIGKHTYALKLFKKHNVSNEFRALVFLVAQGAMDAMKTFAAKISPENASDDISWMLSEFVPQSPPLAYGQWYKRGHRLISDIARQHQIFIGYQHDRVRGILVDAGYIRAAVDTQKTSAEVETHAITAEDGTRMFLDKAARKSKSPTTY